MFDLVPFQNKNLPARAFFDQFMNDFLDDGPWSPLMNMNNAFRVDLRETNNEYIVEADLPGVKKDEITLNYENGYLTISAKKENRKESKEESYVRKERRYGQFQRHIYIDNVVEDKIDAKFNDGVLTVNLQKQDKDKRPYRNIQIH